MEGLKDFNKCPFCIYGKPEWKIEKAKYVTKKGVMERQRYYCECNVCGESFTTTNSDTLSIQNLKVKKK